MLDNVFILLSHLQNAFTRIGWISAIELKPAGSIQIRRARGHGFCPSWLRAWKMRARNSSRQNWNETVSRAHCPPYFCCAFPPGEAPQKSGRALAPQ